MTNSINVGFPEKEEKAIELKFESDKSEKKQSDSSDCFPERKQGINKILSFVPIENGNYFSNRYG